MDQEIGGFKLVSCAISLIIVALLFSYVLLFNYHNCAEFVKFSIAIGGSFKHVSKLVLLSSIGWISTTSNLRLQNHENHENDSHSFKKIKSIHDYPIDKNPTGHMKLEPNPQKTEFKIVPKPVITIRKEKKFMRNPKRDSYEMRSKIKGVFFFVNVIQFEDDTFKKRSGAGKDRKNLCTLFRELGYEIFYYPNLKGLDFVDLIKRLAKSKYLRGVDSFVMCIGSHGYMIGDDTFVNLENGDAINVDEIVELFSDESCEILRGKPKVFLFNCCRKKYNKSEQQSNGRPAIIQCDASPYDEVDPTETLLQPGRNSTLRDTLICYSTSAGQLSLRSRCDGSYFVTELCKVFARKAWNTDWETMMTIVSKEVKKLEECHGQEPVMEKRQFDKLLYLNPKIYDTMIESAIRKFSCDVHNELSVAHIASSDDDEPLLIAENSRKRRFRFGCSLS